jgi:hypothetical protein
MSKREKDLLGSYQERIKKDRLTPSEGGGAELARLAHRDPRTHP